MRQLQSHKHTRPDPHKPGADVIIFPRSYGWKPFCRHNLVAGVKPLAHFGPHLYRELATCDHQLNAVGLRDYLAS